jgi:hypothetical protein
MHEYPRNQTLDSVSERRVNALAGFGCTQRQREFLVVVMVHAGCFLERQYCAFTRTVRGQNSREFVAGLAARGFARVIEPGPVRRGRLYHVHDKPLYEAIGLPDDRNRRLHSIGRMVERVMILDAVLGDRRCWWLSPAEDKRTFSTPAKGAFETRSTRSSRFGAGRNKIIRCFPDKLPIGVDKEDSGRFVFLYLVTRRIPIDFRQFLIRHHTLFLNLHTWTVRLLVPRRFRKAVALYKQPSARSSGRRWTRASATRWRRTSASGRSAAATSASPMIGSSPRSSDGREWRRSPRCIEPGGEREMWSCGGRRQRHFATIGCTAGRTAKFRISPPNTCSSPKPLTGRRGAKRGAKRKLRQVGAPASAPSHDVLSPLVAP